jgi:hypothetical protein
MIVKALILYGLGKWSKMPPGQNVLFALSLSQVGEFAFVLLSFTMHEGLISKQISDTMMAVVAISMAFTPLMMLVNERFLQPRIYAKYRIDNNGDEADEIDEKNPVIIAGFGHFGNIVGRFLRAHNIGTTILDTDSDGLSYSERWF